MLAATTVVPYDQHNNLRRNGQVAKHHRMFLVGFVQVLLQVLLQVLPHSGMKKAGPHSLLSHKKQAQSVYGVRVAP